MTKYIIQAEPDVVTKKYMTALTDSVLANAVTLGLYKRGTVGSTVITGLSVSHAAAGAQLTITGTGFGSTRGTSSVQFGEPLNLQNWRPCTKEAASYVNWGATSITVTVPAMSPGKAGYPYTYHRVRVNVGGSDSNAADFYMDPETTINSASTQAQAAACFGVNSSITKSGATITAAGNQGADMAGAASNILFDGLTFVCHHANMNGNNAGVVTIGEGNKCVTFLNCHFTGNYDSGLDGANTVKIKDGWSGYGRTEDITFAGCQFDGSGRMDFESVGAGPNAQRVALRDCVFEPCWSQAISWGMGEGSIYSLVDNCLVKGHNNHSPDSLYGGGWESNRNYHIETRNTTFWAGAGPSFNMGHIGVACNLLFTNVKVDWTLRDAAMTTVRPSEVIGLGAVNGSMWRGCYFNLGDDASWSQCAGPMIDSTNNDFGGNLATVVDRANCGYGTSPSASLATQRCEMHGHSWGYFPMVWGNWQGSNITQILANNNTLPYPTAAPYYTDP